jgi:hypothetical protein
MTVQNTIRTRRRFLESCIGLAFGLPMLFSQTIEGYADSLHRSRLGLLNLLAAEAAPERPREGAIEFESSDTRLVDGFRWAKAQALAYVRNTGAVGSWYEAALPGRNAFCMRDVSHMSTGAQFLGLGSRTRNMLHHFAEHISASKKWCTWWEITGDDQPAPVDYQSDSSFWYDLPANFDVLDACYRQWLWTRDRAYVDDDVFLNYYHRTVTDYIDVWDHDHKGIPEHLPGDGHMGIGTYDEDLQNQVLIGADLIAAQYAAFCDYAAIQNERNDAASAAEFTKKAEALKSLYNRVWWDPSTSSYFGALEEDGKFHHDLKASTGGSDIEFPLYFGLTEEGIKTQTSLNNLEARLHLDEAARTGIVGGVEGTSYHPDIFYKYGRTRSAYIVLLALMNPALKRREYPEVSYTVIGNIGAGLMGIRPGLRAATIETFPQLTVETQWAALHHVPVGSNTVSVRHTHSDETMLVNETGPDLVWRAAFPGTFTALRVDGVKMAAEHAVRPGGIAETWCSVPVNSGKTRVVRAEPA